jgi:hypothetical protein
MHGGLMLIGCFKFQESKFFKIVMDEPQHPSFAPEGILIF